MERLSDRELLAAYRRTGSRETYSEVVSRYADAVYATCLRTLGNPHSAEDAAQAAFLVFLKKGRKLSRSTVLVDWLHRTARNCARNLRKTEARRAKHEREAMAVNAKSTPNAVEVERARPQLDAALDSLPTAQRAALGLRYVRGLSRAEVAAELGCPERTVESRLRLGIEKLRARLGKRGVALPAAALVGLLGEEASAPASLIASIQGLSLGTATASAAATATAETTMKIMMWAKVKPCAGAIAVSVALFGGGLLAATAADGGKAKPGPAPKAITLDWQKINAQAAKEYLTPLRPGVPGKQPFWNPYARRFLYAPAFEFKPVKGAKHYRFTVTTHQGSKKRVFEAPHPWVPLTPVWKDLSHGWYKLKVEGLTAKGGAVMGTARITVYGKPRQMKPPKDVEERVFEKAEGFKGPYGKTLTSREYRASALRCLRFMRESSYYKRFKRKDKYNKKLGWVTKHVSAGVSGMVYLAKHSSDAREKEEALTMARNAADFLISISFPEGQGLAHIPPMSFGPKWVKMHTPCLAGHAYLNLYDACKDGKHLLAAKRIAEVYKKLQLPSGTWHYMIAVGDGKAYVKKDKTAVKEKLQPEMVALFLDRLVRQYSCKQYEKTAEAAVKWTLENSFKTYDWKGQFDDQPEDRPPYSNHARGAPVRGAQCLLKKAGTSPEYVAMAEDAVRFGEDQFTWWSRKGPFVREQYICFAAVNGSLTSMISAYLRLYEATGKESYLAKAIALANTLVKTQTKDGCYPTWVFSGGINGWPNCPTATAVFMLKFADFLEKEEKKRAGK